MRDAAAAAAKDAQAKVEARLATQEAESPAAALRFYAALNLKDKIGALHKKHGVFALFTRASSDGVDSVKVEEALNAKNTHEKLIELIFELHAKKLRVRLCMVQSETSRGKRCHNKLVSS